MSKQYTEQPLLEFNPKLPKLSKSEKDVLKLLVEAGKLIVPIYSQQESEIRQKGNFYPKGVSKEEIEATAKKDPAILSPYTVVEKVNDKLKAVPYHVKYAELLKPIADKLNQASIITDNKEFGRLLKLLAKALIEGTYEEATIAGLKMKPYILDISIGPNDHFDDQLFFAKASYQCWVGVIDKERTEKFNNYRSITLSATRKALVPVERVNNYDQVKLRVDDVLLFSGLIARTKFVGLNLPNDLNIVEKYGSEITLFNQLNDLRLKEQIIPTFNKIFPLAFRKGFKFEDLKKGYLRAVVLHELAHSYLHYRNAVKNLQDLFPYIDELAATILGLRLAGSLLLKDIIVNKQLESMIVSFICRSFYHIRMGKQMVNYSLGGGIFINFMIENGALKQTKGSVLPNFMKIFVALQELFSILEKILATGSRKEAESFIKKYDNPLILSVAKKQV